MSGICQSRRYRPRGQEPLSKNSKVMQRLAEHDSARNEGQKKILTRPSELGEKKRVTLLPANEEAKPKAFPSLLARNNEKVLQRLVDPRKEKSRKKGFEEDSDGSFVAEENANELETITPGLKNYRGSPGSGKRKGSVNKIEHFEDEMGKHGLLDKIVSIQKLNNFFEAELGSNKKMNDSAFDDTCNNTTLDKTGKAAAGADPGAFAFPFQKRARSHSPPRNPQLFDQTRNPICVDAPKPLVATNFVVAPQLRLNEKMTGTAFGQEEPVVSEDLECGFSPTDENNGEHIDNDWMYQRLEHGTTDNNKEPGIVLGNMKDPDFIKLVKEFGR